MTEAELLEDARSIFHTALADCSIAKAIQRKVRVVGQGREATLQVQGASFALDRVRHLRVVACGKAAAPMLSGVLSVLDLPSDVDVRGILIAHERPERLHPGFEFYAGGHPLPNQASFDGAQAALELVREAAIMPDVLCLFLVSGGASAMMELPLAPEISLDDTARLYKALVRCGATIAEINCIRKHFSAVKGGRLARAAGSAAKLTMLVSDVPPHHLDALASGPTLPDPTTVADCRELLSRYSLEGVLPPSVLHYFDSEMEETPKPGEIDCPFVVLLDSGDLAASAQRAAEKVGYYVVIDNGCDDMPYADAAAYLVDRLGVLRRQHDRVCLLSAGEVTVSVPPDLSSTEPRRGGRNQHFALHAAMQLAACGQSAVVLSGGSDGIDGDSPAAGAAIGTSLCEDRARLEKARAALAAFDSYPFLAECGATIVTGPTGNNLRDLRVLLAARDV